MKRCFKLNNKAHSPISIQNSLNFILQPVNKTSMSLKGIQASKICKAISRMYSWTDLLQCIIISLLNNGQLQMQLIDHCWIREMHEKVFAAPGDFRGGLGSWRSKLFGLTCHSVGNLLVYIHWSIKANSHVDGIRGPGIHIYLMAHSFLALSAP